jgi:hemin uptake protein HemP
MFEPHHAAPGVSDSGTRTTPVADHRPRSSLAPQRIASGTLLGGGNELVIEHAGQEYRLRLTRNDKLILTK